MSWQRVVFLVAGLVVVASASATEYRPPAAWAGQAQGSGEGNPSGPWSLMQVWPDKVEAWGNYRPLVWKGSRWAATADGHGDAPSASIDKGVVSIVSEGNWGGNPGQKVAALVFTAPADGVYEIQTKVHLKRSVSGGPNYVALLVLDDKAKARTIRSYRFRRGNPEPTVTDEGVFLKAGQRLAWVGRFGDNNKGLITLADLAVRHTPASQAPADFDDSGVRPPPPLPPATGDKAPPVVVEGEQIEFPADAGVVNVKLPPYNAKGDGVTDDTRALSQAIAQGGIIYLPNGVYVVSDQLRYSKGARVPSRCTLQGQSVKGAIIKLRDRTPDFTDPKTPLAVLWTSHFPPQAFQIHIRNLTVHTGVGNPGAIGIQFYANNQGSVEDVRVQTGDGTGAIGLDLGFDNDQGPMLARNIRVEGFDVGVRCARQTTVTTLENISVEGQKNVGFLNDMHCVAMRGFTSRNKCPAFEARDSAAYTCIVEGQIEGLNSDGPGIINEGVMFLRGVDLKGYTPALRNKPAKDQPDLAALPAEWTSHPVIKLWPDSPGQSLNLPVLDAPRLPWGPMSAWQSVKAFEPEVKETDKVARGKKVTYRDWAPAIRQAMAAGKPTVYFPKDNYVVEGEIRVPAHVTRIIGLGSSFDRDRGRAVFVVEDGSQPLRFDRWDWNYSKVTILHKGKRPVVIANTLGSHYQPEPGAGDVFFDDVCQGGLEFLKGQRVFMRQFNPEYGDKPKLVNRGADLWILGIKTEGYTTMIVTCQGGRTEILGGMAYANQGHDPEPLCINLAPSSFSATMGEWVLRSQRFEEIVVEKRGDQIKAVRYDQVPARGDKPNGKPLGGYGTSFSLPLVVGANEGGVK